MKHTTKQCRGLVAHFVGDTITCVRDMKTGKFVKKATWRKATEKQALAKAYAIVALQPINKGYNNGYNRGSHGNSVLSFAVIGVLLAVLTMLLMPTISERQEQYERVTSESSRVIFEKLISEGACVMFLVVGRPRLFV